MGHSVYFLIMVKLVTTYVIAFCALAFMAEGTLGQTTCGDNDVVATRIVGGDEAVKHSIPWQAALVSKGNKGFVWCGGTIIDSTHILTAAHCTIDVQPSQIQVLTGEHDTSDPVGDTVHNVKSIVNHPSYYVDASDTPYYDYSILTIDCNNEIDLTDKARAACLPESDAYEVSGAKFNVSGWGTLSAGGSQPNILNVVTVPFVSDNVCKSRYSTLSEQMMCAGNVEEGGVDSCQGDSGGPLTWRDAQGKWNIIGVVSWGIGCANPGSPGVYAEVFKVLDWVKSNSQAGGNEQCDGSNPTKPTPSTPGPTPAPSTSGPAETTTNSEETTSSDMTDTTGWSNTDTTGWSNTDTTGWSDMTDTTGWSNTDTNGWSDMTDTTGWSDTDTTGWSGGWW